MNELNEILQQLMEDRLSQLPEELETTPNEDDSNNGWISVKDQLPTDEKAVLAYYGFSDGTKLNEGRFMGTLSYFCFDPNPHWQHASHHLVVTHWMPLPEPPKEN